MVVAAEHRGSQQSPTSASDLTPRATSSHQWASGTVVQQFMAAAQRFAPNAALGQWMDRIGLQIGCSTPASTEPEHVPMMTPGRERATPRQRGGGVSAFDVLPPPSAWRRSLGGSDAPSTAKKPRRNSAAPGPLAVALRQRGGAAFSTTVGNTSASKPPQPPDKGSESARGFSSPPRVPQLALGRAGGDTGQEASSSGFAALTHEFLHRGTPRRHSANGLPSSRGGSPLHPTADSEQQKQRTPKAPSIPPSPEAATARRTRPRASASGPSRAGRRCGGEAAPDGRRSSGGRSKLFANWIHAREPLWRFDRLAWEYPPSKAEKKELFLLTVIAEERARREEIYEGLQRERRMLKELGYTDADVGLWDPDSSSDIEGASKC